LLDRTSTCRPTSLSPLLWIIIGRSEAVGDAAARSSVE
jgi:hypothetical protein